MSEVETNPLLDGHEAGELRQDGEFFAQLNDEGLQLCFLTLNKQKHQSAQEPGTGPGQDPQTYLVLGLRRLQTPVFVVPDQGPRCELVEKLNTTHGSLLGLLRSRFDS